ncbi:chloromuconate cycloisomerase [Planctomycetota bacterium]|nr:chloromuconate cycloisomerase [Planctomycetota bacterium]
MPASLSVRDLVLRRPLRTATGTVAIRRVWILSIGDGSGLVGLGEAAPLQDFGGELIPACEKALKTALPLLTDEFVHGWLDRARADAPLGQLERVLAQTPCARSAVEGALLDLLAQLGGTPLAELLSPSYTPFLPVNALADAGIGQMSSALQAIASGYRTIKIKASADPAETSNALIKLRGQVGPEVALRVDANAAWNGDQAVRFAEATRLVDLEYLEQPLPVGDLQGMAALRLRTGMKIAVDESVRTPADVGRVGAAQAADIVVLKPAFLGGWRPIKQAAQLARTCGLEVVVTTAMDSAVGRAHATHIAAALGLEHRAQGLSTGELLVADSTSEPLKPSAGDIAIHARPGLGIGELIPG